MARSVHHASHEQRLRDAARILYDNLRAKDVIKVGGENVSAGEVERVIRQLAAVEECGVVGRPDPTYGERVIAFVTLRAPCDEATIRAHCQAALARFAVPDAVHVLDEMPRVSLGKVAKGALRGMLAGL